jgi:DnaJ-class molecular chaperone
VDKSFAKLNYYEMLDIKPDAAFFEIRHAYNAALQIYQADSLVSYSFFSQEERKEILALLEKAYLTLINEAQRQNYDNELIRLGILADVRNNDANKKPVCIFDIKHNQTAATSIKNASAALKAKAAENKRIAEILSLNEIKGADLKEIRNELGVDLEQIAQETKIRIDYLRSIEEDKINALPALVFLKGFIKSYLRCLYLEPIENLCTRYMIYLAHQGKNK